MVIFAPHNLLSDPPFSRLDLIICRNVMIYFQRELQEDVLDTFHYALKPGGFLVLGNSETCQKRTLPVHRHISQHPPKDKRALLQLDAEFQCFGAKSPQAATIQRERTLAFRRLLLRSSASAHRRATWPAQRANQSRLRHRALLFKRVLENLRVELRTALFTAQKTNGQARSKAIPVEVEGRPVNLVIRVQTPQDRSLEGFHLVIFDE